MQDILEIISVAAISAVKFVFGPAMAFASGLTYWQTLIITAAGGIFGVLFFFYFSQWLAKIISSYKNKMYFLFGVNAEPGKKKVFNWRNRMLVRVIQTFGLAGIAAITPALLSIPLGTFIAARYFRNKRKVVAYLCVSVICWSLILSTFVLIKH